MPKHSHISINSWTIISWSISCSPKDLPEFLLNLWTAISHCTENADGRKRISGVFSKPVNQPCTLDDAGLSCLPVDFHILGQNEQYFFRGGTPYQMQHPLQLWVSYVYQLFCSKVNQNRVTYVNTWWECAGQSVKYHTCPFFEEIVSKIH